MIKSSFIAVNHPYKHISFIYSIVALLIVFFIDNLQKDRPVLSCEVLKKSTIMYQLEFMVETTLPMMLCRKIALIRELRPANRAKKWI